MALIGTCKRCGDSYRINDDNSSGVIRCPYSSLPMNCLLDLEEAPGEYLLFFDTETTGLIDFRSDILAPNQPRVIQLAAIMTDATGKTIETLNHFVKPDGWIVPESASKIHGITTEQCEAEGLPMSEVLTKFYGLIAKSGIRLAYNNSYDEFMMNRESLIYHQKKLDPFVKSYDIMEIAKDFCQIPPTEKMVAAGYNGFKPPKLIDAYEKAFGKAFENAHDALADVKASIELYFFLTKYFEEQANEKEPFIHQQSEG